MPVHKTLERGMKGHGRLARSAAGGEIRERFASAEADKREEIKAVERAVIEELRGYKRLTGRIKNLERYPVGNGYSVQSLSADDKLQELHRKLRTMPSYMYLNKREQQLETIAHAYLPRYALGTQSQLNDIRQLHGADEEDEALLRELERKIQKVLEARMGSKDGYRGIIERISELQDLEQQKEQIDRTLELLAEYQPLYAQLLRLRYIEGMSVLEVIDELNVAKRSFERWRPKALMEYAGLSGLV